jgi:hypothetical protein
MCLGGISMKSEFGYEGRRIRAIKFVLRDPGDQLLVRLYFRTQASC